MANVQYNNPNKNNLQIRRGPESRREEITPLEGEMIFTTDKQDLFIGDGVTAGGVKIAAASLFQGGANIDITFADNVISTKNTNQDIILDPNGTGRVIISDILQAVEVQSALTGNVTGNLTGNVTGDVTGDLTGDSNGTHTGPSFGLHTGAVAGNVTGNVTGNITGQMLGDDASVIVDSTTKNITGNTITGNDFIVNGNLTVNGSTTSLNTTTLDVEDINITLAKGATNSAEANGAGITVDGAGASIIYDSATDSFVFNKNITGDLVGTLQTASQPNITSLGTLTGLTVSGNTTSGTVTTPEVNSSETLTITANQMNIGASADTINIEGSMTVTNPIVNDVVPTAPTQVANKRYVDNKAIALSIAFGL